MKLLTVAETDSSSTLRDTCLAKEVQKSFTKLTMLHGATPAETCFKAPYAWVSSKSFNVQQRLNQWNRLVVPRVKKKPTLSLVCIESSLVASTFLYKARLSYSCLCRTCRPTGTTIWKHSCDYPKRPIRQQRHRRPDGIEFYLYDRDGANDRFNLVST